MKKRILLAAILFLLPRLATAALNPDDFAFGMRLDVESGGAIYRLLIPKKVYETVVHPDLSDIMVFNGDGAAVPFLLRKQRQEPSVSKSSVDLPFFPWHGQGQRDGNTDVSLRLKDLQQQTRVTIETGKQGDQPPPISGYIIDARSLEDSMDALEIDLAKDEENLIATILVEQSHDLVRWERLVHKASLVKMRFRGHEITQTTIPVVSRPDRYLRIRWPDGQEPVTITGVRAIKEESDPCNAQVAWKKPDAIPDTPRSDEKKDGVVSYVYDSGGVFPVDRIKIDFQENNSLSRLRFFSRSRSEEPWVDHGAGLFYNLRFDDTKLAKDTHVITPTSHRLWRITLKGERPASSPPGISLGWIPHELLFVAQGKGPFQLAYGSSRKDMSTGSDDREGKSLLRSILDSNNEKLIKPVILHAPVILGGKERLTPQAPPLPWKKWLLWGTLVIGVLIVAGMALSLIQSMNSEQ